MNARSFENIHPFYELTKLAKKTNVDWSPLNDVILAILGFYSNWLKKMLKLKRNQKIRSKSKGIKFIYFSSFF